MLMNFIRKFSTLAIISLLVFAISGVMQPKSVAAVTPKTAVVYGDSLTWESMWAFNDQIAIKNGWAGFAHTFPGTAPCDWLTWLPQDLATRNPSVVGLTSAGNVSSCVVDGNGVPLVRGTQAYYDKYRTDLDAIFAQVTATGAKMVFVKSPPMLDPVRNAAVIELTNIATELAANYHGVSISSVVRNALSKNGNYTDYKPCLANETTQPGCIGGQIPVRTLTGSQAGLHLCTEGLPAAYPYFCPTYSSGEYRFGKNLANTVVSPPPPILP